ncbi:MAG: sigma-70 family RNA polymerase sigma factor [Acholeplasmatales bacterium]|nr:sigma-70 family RNA polymerase sigma factor [Acholeplasmatales bacterium]
MKSIFLYNDYELIYYIRDGSEIVLKIFIQKYDLVIYSFIQKIPYLLYSGKVDDLMQEGRMVLFKCLQTYRSEQGSFYNYFTVSLRNKFNKLIRSKYYSNSNVYLMEDMSFIPDNDNTVENKYRFLFDEHIEKILYDEYFINGFSLNSIAKTYDIKYSELIQVKSRMVKKLKTYLDTSK